MKYLKQFETEAAYVSYKSGSEFITPNVSWVKAEDVVFYNSEIESGSPAIKVSYIETPVDLSISLGPTNGRDFFYIYDENDEYASGFKYTTKENKDKIQGNYYYFEYDDEYIDIISSSEEIERNDKMGYSIKFNGKTPGMTTVKIYAGSKEYGEHVDNSLCVYVEE